MKSTVGSYAAAALLIVAPALIQAQGNPVELGLDAGVNVSFYEGSSAYTVTVPFQNLRIGFYLSKSVSIEPSISLSYMDSEYMDAMTTANASLSPLFHFKGYGTASQPYFRPFVGIAYSSFGDESTSQINVGGALGSKVSVADQVAVRLEVAVRRYLENDDFTAYTGLTVSIGFSAFTT